MGQFLDMLKARLTDAHRRLQVTQARLQQAQADHQAVMQETTSLQVLVNVETQREQLELQRRAHQQAQPTPPATVLPAASPPATTQPALPPTGPAEVNKAEIIREVLRQHPNGITPGELWEKVQDRVERPYVYSVLKRLKDNKQVTERRGKYYLPVSPKAEEEKEGSIGH